MQNRLERARKRQLPYLGLPRADDFEPLDPMSLEPAPRQTLDHLANVPGVAVYGLLLTTDPTHPVSQVMRERWAEFHHLTGPKFLLVAFEKPSQWPHGVKSDWKRLLGDSFDRVWQYWESDRSTETGLAYKYLQLFRPPIPPAQLPCLVLFDDLDSTRGLVRPLPRWDQESTYRLLRELFTKVRNACDKPEDVRWTYLRRSVASLQARAWNELGHNSENARRYLRSNRSKVIKTAIKWGVLLLTGEGLEDMLEEVTKQEG